MRRVGSGWCVETENQNVDADGVVLAVTVPGLQSLVDASPDLADPQWRRRIASLQLTNPFAVWRLWLDGPTKPGRAPFVGTTGFGALDNISLYHLFEDESRRWSERVGGSVVELHAYATDPSMSEDSLKEDLLRTLHELYPETARCRIVHQRWLLRQDCPAFAPGSFADRPGVETPHDGVTLAGDFVRLSIPSALMERATASGFLAANHLLSRVHVRPEPVLSVPPRGILAAPWRRTTANAHVSATGSTA